MQRYILKVEDQDDHATFMNLDITMEEGTFIYNLFNERDSFLFSIVRMHHMESNIPQNLFCSAIKREFLRIARSALCLRDFVPKAEELLERMNNKVPNVVSQVLLSEK